MVFFTCNSCGQSLKKNAVENHQYRCKISEGLSCMDCHKVFWDDYGTHLSCISEDQKYGSSDFKPKVMKGEAKQEEWINNILAYLNNTEEIDPDVKNLLMKVSQLSNVPRKEKSFINFMLNTNRGCSRHLIDKVWKILSSLLTNLKQKKSTEPPQNGDTNREESKISQSKVNKKQDKSQSGSADKKGVDFDNNGPADKHQKKSKQNIDTKSENSKISKSKKGKEKRSKSESTGENGAFDNNEPVDKPKKKSKKRPLAEMNSEAMESADLSTIEEKKQVDETLKKRKKKKCDNHDESMPLRISKKNSGQTISNGEHITGVVANGHEEIIVANKKTKKDIPEISTENIPTTPLKEFKWKTTLKKAIQQSPDGRIKLKKLQKTIVSQYLETQGLDKAEHEMEASALFNTKIQNEKFAIEGKYIKLK